MEKMSSSIGVRQLTVLGEFKPFGLIAEALDGKVADDAVTDKYEYFLFDPEITRDTDVEDSCDEVSSALTSCGDNELFIRGNRIIWSTGARVFKRFTLRSPVVKVCWCRMGHTAEALLCILQIDCLTIYNNSGEVVSPPLSRAVSSIWPLPFGLLLQQEVEGNIPSRAPFSSTSPLIGARDMFTAPNHMQKGEGNAVCSHLILMDPLDEQEPIFIEDRGKSNVMKEYDEKTIWTSDRVPLMASYNKGKMQHSLWVAEIINSNFDEATACSSNVNPMGVLPKHVSFRRIWHGKGAQMAACKVFMATNDDATPLVCFFHQEQRKLLSVGLQSVEINNEIVFDVKPDMSWIIDAVAAAPVTVTRPRVKVGLLPYSDIIVLAPDNVLLLYSGRQCLCRYVLPSCLNKGQHLYDLKFPETSFPNDLKISGLADAVEGRVNVIVNNRQMFRCALRQSPSSLLANDCITALAEGLSSSFYRHFLGVLWRDGDPAHLSEAKSSVDSEWDSFCHVIMQLCRKSNDTSQKCSGSVAHSAWDFLLNSQFHNNFCKLNSMFGTSGAASLDQKKSNFSKSLVDSRESYEKPFYSDLLVESLDSLHALYENLKFDNLRKRDLELLAILLCNIAEFLGEDNYLDHYIRDFPGLCKKFMLSRPTSSHKICPSLFRWLENCLQHGCNYTNICDLPPLVRRDASSVVSLARQIVSFYSILSGAELQGKNLSSGVHCNISMGSHGSKEELTVLAMVGERFGLQQLDSLPSGISLPLRHVRRLLCSSRPVAIQTSVSHSASDQDLQQAQLWHLAQRTTSLPLGRGAFTLATIYTLLTEAFTVPKLVLAGRLPAQQNATVNLDPNIRNIQELKSWPEFHNAVAAGLRLAPLQGRMSRTWIIYNKPEEPNSVHAGLLLALGLHGHLRVLSITDIYQYFNQEHESTTVGLMLGLAASYRGTMQPAISKSLYIHIPGRHPSSYPELELPTLLQSAALMSLGILYEGSAHPQTMQALLGEIGRRSGGDNVLEREGHAVSAGFALGLVALGHGEDTLGFINTFVNRLFLYIGGKVQNERSHFSTNSMDENRGSAQMMDGTTINIDVTAPGATVALALMFLKTESEAIVSRLPIPSTYFDLQYVRPDFIMLRVIARNLIMWSRVHPSKDWVLSQIPQVVKCGVEGLGGDGDGDDVDDMDAEAFVQAYVNVVAGACISLGLVFAGTRNGNAQELLYEFAIYFLNEIKPVSPTSSGKVFPKGLSRYIDRVTLETCLHLIVLSLSVVMAGSGHLQTFRLLRFLRSRNCADGQSSYGIQMAVSLATGFLFLGGGMRTFSTNNSAIAALLITLYPRMPTGPNDNRCHLQAFRHLYVLATEARWVQTVDVDTGLPVYAPLDVTIRETEHYAESSFCEVTPCLLPERAILKRIRVCGPRYWPQVIDFAPEDKPWWNFGDKNNPFNSGVLYIKRKVGACSYVDDPIGCQSLLSRAMHKVFGLTSSKASDTISDIHSGSSAATVDQLVSTFSSDPSLIAFAQLCCDPSWYSRSDADFKEFCLQVLFECVSKDRPALLQVYLSLYTTVESMVGQVTTGAVVFGDSLSISAFKLALTYIEALMTQKLSAPKGGIIQSTFVGSLRKQVEELLNGSQELRDDFHKYLKLGTWPNGESQDKRSILLSWFLHWYDVPTSSAIKFAIDRVKPKLMSSSSVPLLHLCFPRTHINVISEIYRCFSS
ncbi:anaphase-promoting complex subunit 1 isoform X4 [Arachis ipaensis]|uniref:anaphase-promoting complex subunit 1 isoform X4 n=1 Tax=Arachis ipaensis TaxID=130454 RepID=UPI000A2B502C|nr:anaphase-promoting complex subunit 1 isoform X4 [Arachis ipaensis]XP_029150173.1 anaphase-promoting complex subunit 1 isoform X4 [Arachis hypogaea]